MAAHGDLFWSLRNMLKKISVGDSYSFGDESVKKQAEFGRLEITKCNISKECISDYKGSALPNWQRLGLDPNRIYRIYRPAQTLIDAAKTFNSVPVTIEHPDSFDTPIQAQQRIGATGSDTHFEAPYLVTSMKLWDLDAIKGVQDGTRREISIFSTLDIDMISGDFNGQHYDGVIKNLVGNNVALTIKGRVGSDVAIGDSLTKEVGEMGKNKLIELLKSKNVSITEEEAEEIIKAISSDAKPTGDEADKSTKDDSTQSTGDDEDKKEDEKAEDEDEKKSDKEEKKPMGDSQIKELMSQAEQRALKKAKEHYSNLMAAQTLVEPVFGKVVGDSADDIYKAVLKSENIPTIDLHFSALKPMTEMLINFKKESKAVGDSVFNKMANNSTINFGEFTGD